MILDQYKESQKFTQVWLWVILMAVSLVTILPTAKSLFDKETISTTGVFVFLAILLFLIALNALFYVAKLETKIDKDQVSIVFRPFINKPKAFRWEDIKEAHVRKYNSLTEFGGWGIRYGWNGKAYNTSGNQGLQLVLKSGNKVLIGTQKPSELEAYLKKHIFTDSSN